MKLARVIGSCVSTRKVETIVAYKILIIQPIDDDLKPEGEPILALDTVRAGTGSTVLWVSGREASLPLDDPFAPVDATIVGIVDNVEVGYGE
ncbi:MAG: EutN/CcmL family microcompartment protein [bacterium]